MKLHLISKFPCYISFSLLFILQASSFLTLKAQGTINSSLVYDNIQLTPITNTKVYLKIGNTLVDSTISDANGQFSFSNLAPATYKCHPLCTKPWGGANSIDALLVLKHHVQVQLLGGLRLKAADVNGSGTPNSADALAIVAAWMYGTSIFMPPNVPPPGGSIWYYQDFSLTINGNAVLTQQIKMLCAGDVNGSHVP